MESTAQAAISNFPPDGIFSLRESATFGKYDLCNQLNLMTKYWAVSFGYIWTYYDERLKQWRLKLDEETGLTQLKKKYAWTFELDPEAGVFSNITPYYNAAYTDIVFADTMQMLKPTQRCC